MTRIAPFALPLTALFLCTLLLSGCKQNRKQTEKTVVKAAFTQPPIPSILQSPEERAAYAITHYWDNFDFADTSLVHNDDITEQAFVNYLNLFPFASIEVIEKGISQMLERSITADTISFNHFAELYEKYLYDPNSPFRQEDYYIAVLRSIIANEHVDEIEKIRPRYLLNIALKNRPGTIATDFVLTLKGGRSMKLSAISAEYTILFFNNLDCNDCARVKQMLSKCTDPRITIVAVCPDENYEKWLQTEYPTSWISGYNINIISDETYDLKAIPTLYLLDREKRVILKDAPVEVIFDWLKL